MGRQLTEKTWLSAGKAWLSKERHGTDMKDGLLHQIWKIREADRIWTGGMGAMLLLLLLFLEAAVHWRDSMILWAVLYGAMNLLVLTAVCFALSRHVRNALYALGDMMEELINGHEPEEEEMDISGKMKFPVAEDTILSKLQGQILKLYDMLRVHEEQERKLRKQLDENIGNLVHQINTPITNIRLYAGFLKRDDLTEPERTRFLRCMEEQADKLFWMGESFSKVSRLETGIIHLKPKKQEIESAVLSAVDQVMIKAERKEMEITLSGKTQVSARIDSKWTTEALFNILDNAVKYGKPGTKIEIAVTELVSYVSLAIRNRSEQAISPNEYPLLFKRFYRGRNNTDVEGVGLGLYIARRIFEDEKAYIQAGKTPDGRTEFVVCLYKN